MDPVLKNRRGFVRVMRCCSRSGQGGEIRVDLQLMGPRGQSLESWTALGQRGGHTSIIADISHTAARQPESPCLSWSLSKQGPGQSGTREREMENRSNCYVSVQSTSKLASAWAHQLSARDTGKEHGAFPLSCRQGSKCVRLEFSQEQLPPGLRCCFLFSGAGNTKQTAPCMTSKLPLPAPAAR